MQDREGLRITLKGPGISIDKDVPAAIAGEVIRLLLGGTDARSAVHRTGLPSQPEAPGTLAEAFQLHEPKRYPDKIAVIAYHLKQSGRPTLTKEEIRGGFRRAGEREPSNFDRDWSWAVRNGWIGGDATAGFYLTRTGEKVVRGNFAQPLLEKTKHRPRRGAIRRTASVPGEQ